MMDFPDASRARRAGFWSTLRLGARMMMRDARAGELRLLVLALVVAVAAVTSVGFLADRVGRALERDAGQMLGADLVLDADEPVPDAFLRQARQRGLEVSRTWQFPSMVSAGDGAQLAALKAVEPVTRCAARCAWPRAVRPGRAGARHSLRRRGLGRRPAAVAAEPEDRRPAQRGRHAPAHRAGGEL